jgi:hypothetical protein
MVYIPEQLEQDINEWIAVYHRAESFVEEVRMNKFYGSEGLEKQISSYPLCDDKMNQFIVDYCAQLEINETAMSIYESEQEEKRLREEKQQERQAAEELQRQHEAAQSYSSYRVNSYR